MDWVTEMEVRFALAQVKAGADIIDIDYPQSIKEARVEIKSTICLAGNLNPVSQLRKSNPAQIKKDFALCYE